MKTSEAEPGVAQDRLGQIGAGDGVAHLVYAALVRDETGAVGRVEVLADLVQDRVDGALGVGPAERVLGDAAQAAGAGDDERAADHAELDSLGLGGGVEVAVDQGVDEQFAHRPHGQGLLF